MTMEEIFDVVDEHDRVIDQQPRSVVHRNRLLHRATHIMVFNSNGQLFLQKRSMSKDSSPGLWDTSAAGHLDQGEGYGECAIRELAEELGISLGEPLRKLFKLEATPQTDYEFAWVYGCNYDGAMQLQVEEIDEGAWFDPAEIDRWLSRAPEEITSVFQLIWRRYRESED